MNDSSKTVVWFDLDDTLWDFKNNSHDALAEVYDHFNLNRFWADVDSWRESYHLVNDRLWKELAEGNVSMPKLRWDRFHTPLIEAGADEDEANMISEKADKYYLERLGVRGKVVDGAIELLTELKSKGYRIGIISNGFTDVQYNKMKSSGIDRFIDYVVLSEDVGVSKPNTAIFRYAQKFAGVPASNCIMIGDNESTDITGAIKSMWKKAIWYNPRHAEPQQNLTTSKEHHTQVEIVDSLSKIVI